LEKHRLIFEWFDSRKNNTTPSGAGNSQGNLDWGWYGVVSLLAKDNVLKIEEIAKLPIVKFLNHYAFLTWHQQKKD